MRRIAIVLTALVLVGCASMNQKCEYYADGVLKYVRTRSTVVGTGETEVVSMDCADLSYSTLDTGISENGSATVIGLGELAADAATGGATAVVRKLGE